jgi:magnesium transporter
MDTVELTKLKEEFDNWLFQTEQDEHEFHPSEIANILKMVYQEDRTLFLKYIDNLDTAYIGEIILELPDKLMNEVIEYLTPQELSEATNNLESDDASDLVRGIESISEHKVEEVLSLIDDSNKQEINKILQYKEDQAGAWMQTEFLSVFTNNSVQDAIKKLRELKKSEKLKEIYQVFVVNSNMELLGSMRLDDLLMFDIDEIFVNILKSGEYQSISVKATDHIKVVGRLFEDYNLQVVSVLDENSRIIGRITSDDAYDMISELATEQVYNMAGVNDDVESGEKFFGIIKTRSSWLLINLFTAFLASAVVGLFESTLQTLVSLAVLMPIVASMGGNAGTQAITVVVRQLALDEIGRGDGMRVLFREVGIGLTNGFIFSGLTGLIAYLWFGDGMLGVVIGLALIINLFIAGFFGAVIPLSLKKFGFDPAVGSSVLLTTATDIFGFFSFLGLAKTMLL